MSIPSIFSVGKQAMNAQGTAFGNISQNVTNMKTPGYKAMDTNFQALLSDLTSGNSGGGLEAQTTRNVSKQGTMLQTDRNTDLAIQGNGFFVVQNVTGDTTQTLYSRDGGFHLSREVDADTGEEVAYLVNGNGDYLMGVHANAEGEVPPLNEAGELTRIQVDKNHLGTYTGDVTTDITLSATLPGAAGAVGAGEVNFGVTTYLPATDPDTGEATVTAGTLQFDFTKDDPHGNTWDVATTLVDGDHTSEVNTTLTFERNEAGQPVVPEPAVQELNYTLADGTNKAITVDFSQISQFGDEFLFGQAEQNGVPAGAAESFRFDNKGQVLATYTNGRESVVGRIAVASMINPNGLAAETGNVFSTGTGQAGEVTVAYPGEGGGTTILPAAIEQSNVDVGREFANMIMTQRAYSAASKIITTADELTQTARDMSR